MAIYTIKIPYVTDNSDPGYRLRNNLGFAGRMAAIEIGPDSEVDSVYVSGPNLSERFLEVGSGLIGPIDGPLYLRGTYLVPTLSGGATISFLIHDCIPPQWVKKRGVLWKSVTSAAPFTGFGNAGLLTIPIFGRSRGFIGVRNLTAQAAHYQIDGFNWVTQTAATVAASIVGSTAIAGNATASYLSVFDTFEYISISGAADAATTTLEVNGWFYDEL